MKYVVLGASASGVNGAATLRKLDPEAEIVLVSEDANIYSRCILHHYMEGIRSMEGLSFVEHDFMKKHTITWKKGTRAVGLTTQKKEVLLSTGEYEKYDRLLIATGSRSFIPPIEGLLGAKNVCGFHDFPDCEKVLKLSKRAEHIVILGAGLVGVDVACGLLGKDKHITMIDMKEHMLAMQLDEKAAGVYEREFEKRGVTQHYNVGISKVEKNEEDEIVRVVLSDQTKIPCDLFIAAAGVRANVEFLKDSEVKTDRYGLVIDDTGKTNVADIYGAGDVTGQNPIWPVAVKEGIIAASNMAGVSSRMTDFFASKSTMNFFGIPTMSLGIHEVPDETYLEETMGDTKGNYKKIIHKDGKICGALLQGDISYAGVLTQLIRRKIDVSKVKKPLFHIDYSDFFHMKENFEFEYEEGQEVC